jgi:hypothetical protein
MDGVRQGACAVGIDTIEQGNMSIALGANWAFERDPG